MDVSPKSDAVFMARALRLAEKGRYSTLPNPCVGSVIVKDGVIIGEGFHLQAGQGHAEANAIASAKASLAGATVYCTLEPCSFHGRTPSCAQALIDAGVARVVAAMEDPHTRNCGKGHSMLREAGIRVDCGLMESSARALNPGHIKRFETGMPYVRVKLAMSMDGKTALANGESKWITSPAARCDVQKWRARSSAIVTGVQTINDDDPQLNVREADLRSEHATLSASIARPVYILDPKGRVNRDAGILKRSDTTVVSLDSITDLGCCNLIGADDGKGRIDLPSLLRDMAALDCNEVLVECGPTLAGAFIDAGMVDELVLYTATTFLGADARSLLNLVKLDSMQDQVDFELSDTRRIGADLRLICIPKAR